MKRIIAKQTHYKSLLNTCKRHPEFAEGKALLQGMIVELETREARISEILSDIYRPVSIFYAIKQHAEKQMSRAVYRFTSLGELVAIYKDDDTMHLLMKTYQAQLYKVSAHRLYLNALSVADALQEVDTNLSGPDFRSRQLPEFRKQIEDFGVQLDTLADQLLRRKVLKQELAKLIASTNLFLRDGFDHAVNYLQYDYPDFYREYWLVRQPHKRKRRTSVKIQPETPGAISTTRVSIPVLAANPEPKQQAIASLPLNPVSLPVTTPIVTEDVCTDLENKIPADYLTQISELIYPDEMRWLDKERISDN